MGTLQPQGAGPPADCRDRRATARSVSPETIEFRLSDGSAHPHLLLAGIAQAMIAGKEIEDIDALLEQTSVHAQKATALSVPRSFSEVADELRERRASFEAAGIFPAHVMDRVIDALAAL